MRPLRAEGVILRGGRRARRERPRHCCRIPEERDEFAAARRHSITSSAIASKPGGKVRPSVFAVFKLTTNSNLVG